MPPGEDGEGLRYIGRVTSVSAKQVCVGPVTSSDSETCGLVPDGQLKLPQVGQCVGLFAKHQIGSELQWSAESILRHYEDADCK
jgi:hypothetical protein